MNKFKILKSTKKILIATNNPGKFKEIKELLPRKIRYFKPKDFNMKNLLKMEKPFKLVQKSNLFMVLNQVTLYVSLTTQVLRYQN